MVTAYSFAIKFFLFLFVFIIIWLVFIGLFINNKSLTRDKKIGKVEGVSTNLPANTEILQIKQLPDYQFVAVIKHNAFDGLGIALLDKDYHFKDWLSGAKPIFWKEYPGEHLDWWNLEDINNDSNQELAIQFSLTGTSGTHPFYLYQYNGNSFELLLKLEEGKSSTDLADLNSDGIKEILYSFVLDSTGYLGRTLTPWKEIWAWQEGKYQLANNLFPIVYQEMIIKYEKLLENSQQDSLSQPYQPTIECLKMKGQSNINGVLADGKECRSLTFGSKNN